MFPITLYFDGACPICHAEMDALRRRDTAGRLAFIDIAAPGFAPPAGLTLEALDHELHATLADGTVLRGLDSVRAAYGAVGLGAWLAPARWPLVGPFADRAYLAFARRRHALPAPLVRGLVAVLGLKAGRAAREAAARPRCADGACAVPPHD